MQNEKAPLTLFFLKKNKGWEPQRTTLFTLTGKILFYNFISSFDLSYDFQLLAYHFYVKALLLLQLNISQTVFSFRQSHVHYNASTIF